MARIPIKTLSQQRRIKARAVEMYFWLIIGLLIIYPVVLETFKRGKGLEDIIYEHYTQALFASLSIIFPTLFKLIFGYLPFEFIRAKRTGKLQRLFKDDEDGESKKFIDRITTNYIEYKVHCISESKSISEKIFYRSGAYLLIGCLIAFFGIGIFYSKLLTPDKAPSEFPDKILSYLPRFGALFFIEFIAFFFLKQYRIMIEEYKYYESIKRKRQDELNLTLSAVQLKDDKEALKIIVEELTTEGKATKINSTLELEKILSKDYDLFGKLTDFVKALKIK